MDSTWWVNPNQLDDDQKKVISLPLKKSHLVLGPPGSGKSNLLLLRADFLQRSGNPNSVILVFTRQLQDFMRSGSSHYSFPATKIRTSRAWALELLRENDIQINLSDDFEKSRIQISQELNLLINEKKLRNLYEYILLDETQDYLPAEIGAFCVLARYVFAVGDTKQKIYKGEDGLSYLRTRIEEENVFPLKHHYRNGLKICYIADGIAKQTEDYVSMASTSNYNEKEAPSSVELYKCISLEEMYNDVISKIDLQLKAYPGELVGILTPRKDELRQISDLLRNSKYYKQGQIQMRDDSTIGIDDKRPVVVSTIHSAKGLEFRALHLCCLEYVKRFPKQRNTCFTGVTRAKTALYIYHIDGLPGYFEQAYMSLNRPPSLPSVEDLFENVES